MHTAALLAGFGLVHSEFLGQPIGALNSSDEFILSEGSGYDFIEDFTNGEDRLSFGSAVQDLTVQNHFGHALVYKSPDLLALVQDNFLV